MSLNAHIIYVTVNAPHLLLLLSVLLLLLVLLRDDIIQEAQLVLREHVVHCLPHRHQGQDLTPQDTLLTHTHINRTTRSRI